MTITFQFQEPKNIMFVANQLQLLEIYENLVPSTATEKYMEWRFENNCSYDELCLDYKQYLLDIFNILYDCEKICKSNKAIFYYQSTEEYYKPERLLNGDVEYEHLRLIDFVVYKRVMGEKIVNLIDCCDMQTGIFYFHLNDYITKDHLMVDKFGDEYHYAKDDVYTTSEKPFNEVLELYNKKIKYDMVVYHIEPNERTIDFDEFNQRTSCMVQLNNKRKLNEIDT
tara:strand:+ start:138 stop:815 length:678 start_codon:yes stop_codon:yes gene_type:complete